MNIDIADPKFEHIVKHHSPKNPKQKKYESWYYDGRAHGNWLAWYSSGQLKERGEHRAGEPTGAWFVWRENGKLFQISQWKDGELHGAVIEFDNEDHVSSRTNFINGVDISELVPGDTRLSLGLASGNFQKKDTAHDN